MNICVEAAAKMRKARMPLVSNLVRRFCLEYHAVGKQRNTQRRPKGKQRIIPRTYNQHPLVQSSLFSSSLSSDICWGTGAVVATGICWGTGAAVATGICWGTAVAVATGICWGKAVAVAVGIELVFDVGSSGFAVAQESCISTCRLKWMHEARGLHSTIGKTLRQYQTPRLDYHFRYSSTV